MISSHVHFVRSDSGQSKCVWSLARHLKGPAVSGVDAGRLQQSAVATCGQVIAQAVMQICAASPTSSVRIVSDSHTVRGSAFADRRRIVAALCIATAVSQASLDSKLEPQACVIELQMPQALLLVTEMDT